MTTMECLSTQSDNGSETPLERSQSVPLFPMFSRPPYHQQRSHTVPDMRTALDEQLSYSLGAPIADEEEPFLRLEVEEGLFLRERAASSDGALECGICKLRGKSPPWKTVLLTSVGFVTFAADVGTHWLVAVVFGIRKQFWWFGLTIVFILIAQFLISCLNLIWYNVDPSILLRRINSLRDKRMGKTRKSVDIRRIGSVTALIQSFLLGPIMRHMDYIRLSFRRRRFPTFHDQCCQWENLKLYITLTHLVESHVESLPQIIIQTYILLETFKNQPVEFQGLQWCQIVSIGLSVLSTTFSVLASGIYHKTQTTAVRYFTGHVLVLGMRTLTLTLFAVRFGIFSLLVFGAHWISMLVCVVLRYGYKTMSFECFSIRTSNDLAQCSLRRPSAFLVRLVYYLAFPIMYVFDYPQEKFDTSFSKAYYLLVYVENVVLITLWMTAVDVDYTSQIFGFRLLAALTVTFGYSFGVFVLGVYETEYESDRI